MDINNHIGKCIFCGHTGCSINSRNYSANTVSTVINLLFQKIRAHNASELCIQDLFSLSTTNKCFMKASQGLWELIMQGFTSNGFLSKSIDRTISAIKKLPLIDLMKSIFQIDKLNITLMENNPAYKAYELEVDDARFVYHVAQNNYTELLEILISSGADVNTRGGEFHIPLLMLTTENHNERGLQALIKAGANVDAQDVNKHTALDYANKECALALLSAGARVLPVLENILFDPAPHVRFRNSSLPIFITEMAAHGLIDTRDKNHDKTLLLRMAYSGNENIVRMCLGASANIDATCTQYDQTALMYAIKGCHLDVVKTLIGAGADVNCRSDVTGQTALGCARKKLNRMTERSHPGKPEKMREIIRILEDESLGAIE